MAGPLDLHDLVSGLREVVTRARKTGIRDVSIRIVGGAALRIAYFERATTADIDAQIQPLDQLEPIIRQIASERDWPADWLNDKATIFIPRWGRSVEWEALFEDFYPGDALTERAVLLLERILAKGLPKRPSTPPRPDFS